MLNDVYTTAQHCQNLVISCNSPLYKFSPPSTEVDILPQIMGAFGKVMPIALSHPFCHVSCCCLPFCHLSLPLFLSQSNLVQAIAVAKEGVFHKLGCVMGMMTVGTEVMNLIVVSCCNSFVSKFFDGVFDKKTSKCLRLCFPS